MANQYWQLPQTKIRYNATGQLGFKALFTDLVNVVFDKHCRPTADHRRSSISQL